MRATSIEDQEAKGLPSVAKRPVGQRVIRPALCAVVIKWDAKAASRHEMAAKNEVEKATKPSSNANPARLIPRRNR